jgi:hypothetical protein
MLRFLIWTEGDNKGWACSNCRWRFPVPTFLSGEDAKGAYDRLAAIKFKEHECEGEISPSEFQPETKPDTGVSFAERARVFIRRGYTPKVAVELVLHEIEVEHGSRFQVMEKARADAEDFLVKVRKGII